MEAPTPAAIAAAPLMPALPSTTFWTEEQWAVFWAIVEAALPSIHPASSAASDDQSQSQITLSEDRFSKALAHARDTLPSVPSEEQFRDYLDFCPAKDTLAREHLTRTVNRFPADAKKGIGVVLSTLTTRLGSLLLTGYWAPIHLQPVSVREAILKSWLTSRIGTLRGLAGAFTTITQNSNLLMSPLFHDLSGYPETSVDELAPSREPAKGFEFDFIQFPRLPSTPGTAQDTPTDPKTVPDPATVETEILIVGSGCGGAVCAKRLAEAGHDVLVVDKGYHFAPAQLPMSQEHGCAHLYEHGGFVMSRDSSLTAVAGSCWGGGGTVNWSVSLQTQGHVRREWAQERGLPFFESGKFQDCLDHVCGVMGVGVEGGADDERREGEDGEGGERGRGGGTTQGSLRHNHANRVLLDGARRLGWAAEAAPQNTGGEEHYCGRCALGCRSGGKKGPAVSWLPAAARAGARFIEGFEVDRVTFDRDEEGGNSGGKRANGVVGRWTSRLPDGNVGGSPDDLVTREVVVKAKKVIISSGSLWSPVLLMRSDLTNRHIGQNLHVHPCHFVVGVFDTAENPWEGGIITSHCTAFENMDKAGHGVQLETTSMVPYSIISSMPWRGALESKLQTLKYPRMNAFISLTRDRDAGSIAPDSASGRPRMTYSASSFDRAHALEGVIALAKICYVEGAREIMAFLPGVEPFVRDEEEAAAGDINNPGFVAWLNHVREVGNDRPQALMTSAHQMGTCRMAANEDEGVVDPGGRVFGTEGLYVADASVFPSASGVNPMITNMAISDWIASCVSKDIEEGREKA